MGQGGLPKACYINVVSPVITAKSSSPEPVRGDGPKLLASSDFSDQLVNADMFKRKPRTARLAKPSTSPGAEHNYIRLCFTVLHFVSRLCMMLSKWHFIKSAAILQQSPNTLYSLLYDV